MVSQPASDPHVYLFSLIVSVQSTATVVDNVLVVLPPVHVRARDRWLCDLRRLYNELLELRTQALGNRDGSASLAIHKHVHELAERC